MIPRKPRHCKPKQQELPLRFTDQSQHVKDHMRNWSQGQDILLRAVMTPHIRRIDRSLCD